VTYTDIARGISGGCWRHACRLRKHIAIGVLHCILAQTTLRIQIFSRVQVVVHMEYQCPSYDHDAYCHRGCVPTAIDSFNQNAGILARPNDETGAARTTDTYFSDISMVGLGRACYGLDRPDPDDFPAQPAT